MVGHNAQAACRGLSGRRGSSDGVPASRARAPSELSGQHVVLCWIAWSPASLISIRCDAPINSAFTGHLSCTCLALVRHRFSRLRANHSPGRLPAPALHNVRIWQLADSRASGLSVALPDCSNHAPVWVNRLVPSDASCTVACASAQLRAGHPPECGGDAGHARINPAMKSGPTGAVDQAHRGRWCRRWWALREPAATGCPRQCAGRCWRCRSGGSTRLAASALTGYRRAIRRRCARQRSARPLRSWGVRRLTSGCARR